MKFYEMANNRESESEACSHPGIRVQDFPEAIENGGKDIGGNSDAGVGNLNLDMIAVPAN